MKEKNKIEFLKHYEPIHNKFCKFCRAISGNSEDSEDLIQDTILTVLEKFTSIKDLSSFKTYLFSTASNLNKMKQRRKKFNASFNADEYKYLTDSSQDPEYLADFKIMYETILSLPHKTAETLILFHISDLSLEEIRKIQGGSLSAVKSRLKRGREKVLALLNTEKQVSMAIMFLTF